MAGTVQLNGIGNLNFEDIDNLVGSATVSAS